MQHNCCHGVLVLVHFMMLLNSRDPGGLQCLARQLPRRMRVKGQALGDMDEGGWTNNKMGSGQKLLRADYNCNTTHPGPIPGSIVDFQ